MHSFPKPGYTRTHHKPTQFSHTRYMYIIYHVCVCVCVCVGVPCMESVLGSSRRRQPMRMVDV